MVIKGGARGDAGGLAAHLLNADTNERVEVLELRGVVADDLEGALREMEAVASGTRCSRPLYHASMNTGPGEHMTDEQQAIGIDRLEEKMGLTGQPRVVVKHVKEGREHVHIGWSRIDLEHMRAIPDNHNYRKHEEVARELEREFGHKHVQGAHAEREGVERPARTPSHAEMQQAERTGLSPKEATQQITPLWQTADSGKAFVSAVEGHGWLIAPGDRRDFVLIDPYGETHSLARRIEGAKAKDVRERMADVDPASLPTIAQACDLQHERQIARDEARGLPATPEIPATKPSPEPNKAPPAHELAPMEKDHGSSPREESKPTYAIGSAATETANKGLHVASRVGGKAVKLTNFLDSSLTSLFVAPRKISPDEYLRSADARREYMHQQIAERERAAALERMHDDIAAGVDLDPVSVSKLSADDAENIKAKGDEYLRRLIDQHQQEQKRQRDYGGRERE